jgi:hypothetical protein
VPDNNKNRNKSKVSKTQIKIKQVRRKKWLTPKVSPFSPMPIFRYKVHENTSAFFDVLHKKKKKG